MKILILGASGKLGREIMKVVLEKGHNATAFVRDPGRLQDIVDKNLYIVKGDALNINDLRQHVNNVDAVINCVGARCKEDSDAHLCTKVTQAVIQLNPKKYFSITHSSISFKDDEKRNFSDSIFTKSFIKKNPSDYEDRCLEKETLVHSQFKNWTLIRIKEIEIARSGYITVNNKKFKPLPAKSGPLGGWILEECEKRNADGQALFAWSDKG